jgi:NADH:ubiquinone oxidoreductase subunit
MSSCMSSEKGTHYYDAKEIPPEWHQWLTSKRETPPSAESVQQAEAARNALREKAAALEDAQIGERLRVRFAVSKPDTVWTRN